MRIFPYCFRDVLYLLRKRIHLPYYKDHDLWLKQNQFGNINIDKLLLSNKLIFGLRISPVVLASYHFSEMPPLKCTHKASSISITNILIMNLNWTEWRFHLLNKKKSRYMFQEIFIFVYLHYVNFFLQTITLFFNSTLIRGLISFPTQLSIIYCHRW